MLKLARCFTLLAAVLALMGGVRVASASSVTLLDAFATFPTSDFSADIILTGDGTTDSISGVTPTSSQLLITIDNTGPVGIIKNVYLEDAWGDSGFLVSSSSFIIDRDSTGLSGVDFEPDGLPAAPPGGASNFGWDGNFERFRSINPAPTFGVGPGEWLALLYNLDGVTSTQAFLDALGAGIIDPMGIRRVAMHVIRCVDDESCTAISVPIPGAIWLFASALLGLFGFGYRRRRAVAA